MAALKLRCREVEDYAQVLEINDNVVCDGARIIILVPSRGSGATHLQQPLRNLNEVHELFALIYLSAEVAS